MDILQSLDINLRKKIKKNVALAPYTTFRIGGPAKYFFETNNEKELIEILKFCKKKKISYFILGGGSNLLISDRGFNGFILKMQNTRCKILDTGVSASAGISISKLINEAKKHNLSGLEYLWRIPGSLGGAIFGNIGARYSFGGAEMKDFVFRVKFLDQNLKIKTFTNKQCKFNYRHSIFKDYKKSVIILSAVLKLRHTKKSEIENVIEKINLHRKKNPLGFSAGCVFKNFQFANFRDLPANLHKILPQKFIEYKKIPAGWLIDRVGLGGKRIGKVKISEKHANFIINEGGAKAADVKALIDLAKREVKKKFNLNLEEENMLVGF